jgi:hypothetical protein
MATRGSIDFDQVRDAARHGTGEKFQMSDGTGVTGNVPVYDADGTLIDGGAPAVGTVTHTGGALTLDQPVFGAGGADAKVGTKSGATNEVMSASGSFTSGNLIKTDASHNAVDAGIALPSLAISVIGITIDGGASPPTTGTKGIIQVPFACTITGWSIIADQSGSANVDICFHSGSAPPSIPSIPNTTTDKISAAAPVALSSAQSAAGGSSAISTWTTALSQWGTVLFNLTSITTCHRITVLLEVTRT